ncbi:MAG: hypothetical protein ABSC65_21645 [Acidobacteriaceae bacterium]|jgi:hypothetical protein
MSLRALFGAFTALGMIAEIGLLIVLLVRRQFKIFPVFTLYIAFNLLSDLGVGALMVLYPIHVARSLAFALLPLQYLLELGILLEITWNVLRPVHASLPQGSVRVFVSAVVLALLGGILLAWHFGNTGNKIQDIKVPLDLMVGLLRMLIFVATAGFAQLLGVGWKNKVLQLATALSFYSAVSLIVSLVERYSGRSKELDGLVSVAFTLELAFLVWVFTTKEVRRREFSPQMEQFLVTLAGRAKLARTALVRMQVK